MLHDQFMGLTPEALIYLSKNEIFKEKIATFGGKYPLYHYQLKNGEYANEFLQEVICSSTYRYFFLGLRVGASVIMWGEPKRQIP